MIVLSDVTGISVPLGVIVILPAILMMYFPAVPAYLARSACVDTVTT